MNEKFDPAKSESSVPQSDNEKTKSKFTRSVDPLVNVQRDFRDYLHFGGAMRFVSNPFPPSWPIIEEIDPEEILDNPAIQGFIPRSEDSDFDEFSEFIDRTRSSNTHS